MTGTPLGRGAQAVVRCHELLRPEPASAARARRLLREALAGTPQQGWLDAAELAVTEVVSNAVLHAHTDITLTVELTPDRLVVQVRDRSPALPVQRSYDAHATTGRGMSLVAAVTSEHGVSDAGPEGKTVWFALAGAPGEPSEDELLAAWEHADWDLDELLVVPPPAGTRTVRLLALPPTLWLAARQHHDALVRELALYLVEHDDVEVDVPATDRARSTVSQAVVAAVEAAAQDGSARPVLGAGHPSPLPWTPASLDLDLEIPPDLGPAFAAMQDTLDAAERLAAAGRLLLRPGLPEIIAVRDWACEQVVAQLAGVAPSPWPGTAQDRFVSEVHDRHSPPPRAWDVAPVRDSDRGVVAADDANRIVAVSAPLAALVGWRVDELVGRRVVALVPPRLREAHVAGFSRHLSTGESHVLGVPLTLPLLRADGTELTCRFLIEQAAAERGRSVYLAWIDPVD